MHILLWTVVVVGHFTLQHYVTGIYIEYDLSMKAQELWKYGTWGTHNMQPRTDAFCTGVFHHSIADHEVKLHLYLAQTIFGLGPYLGQC